MRRWDEHLWVLTEDEFNQLPNGTRLDCIDNNSYVKGESYIDMDTRAGHIAYGVKDPKNHPQRDYFIKFKLVG